SSNKDVQSLNDGVKALLKQKEAIADAYYSGLSALSNGALASSGSKVYLFQTATDFKDCSASVNYGLYASSLTATTSKLASEDNLEIRDSIRQNYDQKAAELKNTEIKATSEQLTSLKGQLEEVTAKINAGTLKPSESNEASLTLDVQKLQTKLDGLFTDGENLINSAAASAKAQFSSDPQHLANFDQAAKLYEADLKYGLFKQAPGISGDESLKLRDSSLSGIVFNTTAQTATLYSSLATSMSTDFAKQYGYGMREAGVSDYSKSLGSGMASMILGDAGAPGSVDSSKLESWSKFAERKANYDNSISSSAKSFVDSYSDYLAAANEVGMPGKIDFAASLEASKSNLLGSVFASSEMNYRFAKDIGASNDSSKALAEAYMSLGAANKSLEDATAKNDAGAIESGKKAVEESQKALESMSKQADYSKTVISRDLDAMGVISDQARNSAISIKNDFKFAQYSVDSMVQQRKLSGLEDSLRQSRSELDESVSYSIEYALGSAFSRQEETEHEVIAKTVEFKDVSSKAYFDFTRMFKTGEIGFSQGSENTIKSAVDAAYASAVAKYEKENPGKEPTADDVSKYIKLELKVTDYSSGASHEIKTQDIGNATLTNRRVDTLREAMADYLESQYHIPADSSAGAINVSTSIGNLETLNNDIRGFLESHPGYSHSVTSGAPSEGLLENGALSYKNHKISVSDASKLTTEQIEFIQANLWAPSKSAEAPDQGKMINGKVYARDSADPLEQINSKYRSVEISYTSANEISTPSVVKETKTVSGDNQDWLLLASQSTLNTSHATMQDAFTGLNKSYGLLTNEILTQELDERYGAAFKNYDDDSKHSMSVYNGYRYSPDDASHKELRNEFAAMHSIGEDISGARIEQENLLSMQSKPTQLFSDIILNAPNILAEAPGRAAYSAYHYVREELGVPSILISTETSETYFNTVSHQIAEMRSFKEGSEQEEYYSRKMAEAFSGRAMPVSSDGSQGKMPSSSGRSPTYNPITKTFQ
ncbi:MAG TPA: hypothetical protein PLO51_00165, partial [Candidatus Micrarchaeota archaeon]|nr:hypothetical protein [Candidatus Micrarchaeota archaeon]